MIDSLTIDHSFQIKAWNFEGLMTNYGGNEADGAEALRHPSGGHVILCDE